eukprot:scaffold40821_cov51-Cyclotella_meneghiniana.AAC.1
MQLLDTPSTDDENNNAHPQKSTNNNMPPSHQYKIQVLRREEINKFSQFRCLLWICPSHTEFHAPKTPSVIKEIGLNGLLLDTDLEDASKAWDVFNTLP